MLLMNECSYIQGEYWVPKLARQPSSHDTCEVDYVDERKVKRVQKVMKASEVVTALAETFKLLGDPTRIKIAFALSREELCVCDLAHLVGASQSAVSHSLRALRQMKLVKFRKEGKIAYYKLDDDHIRHLIDDGFAHIEEL